MAAILSTKKLTSAQRNLLLNSGLGLVEYDSIHIELLDFSLPKEKKTSLIFTSKNAVKAFFRNTKNSSDFTSNKIFCVGQKTADLLENRGFEVIKISNSAEELGEFLVPNFATEEFTYFCGNIRRDELPEILKKHKLAITDIIAYKTQLIARKFCRKFDGILFFSPSAVQSFVIENKITSEALFCIGETTAFEAKKYSDNIIIANKPSIENVIVQVVKQFSTSFHS